MTIEQLDKLRANLKDLVDGYIDNLIDDHAEGGMCADDDFTLTVKDAIEDFASQVDNFLDL